MPDTSSGPNIAEPSPADSQSQDDLWAAGVSQVQCDESVAKLLQRLVKQVEYLKREQNKMKGELDALRSNSFREQL